MQQGESEWTGQAREGEMNHHRVCTCPGCNKRRMDFFSGKREKGEAVIQHRGECSCGWRGEARLVSSDAGLDVKRHCAETGCVDRVTPTAGAPLTEANDPETERLECCGKKVGWCRCNP